MSKNPTRLTPKHYVKPHSMGVLTKSETWQFRPIPLAYEPMRRERWIMNVHGPQGTASFWVKNSNGIRMRTTVEEIPYMSTSTWIRPRYEWDPLTLEIYDYVGENSNPEYIREWMMSHSEMITGRHGYAADYKRTVELEKLDPTGVVIERWVLNGTMISSFNYEVVYDQEMGNMELTIIFDNARLTF
jgi:hypothetical protein